MIGFPEVRRVGVAACADAARSTKCEVVAAMILAGSERYKGAMSVEPL